MYTSNYFRSASRAGGIIFNSDLTQILLVLNKLSFLKGEFKYGLPKGHIESCDNFDFKTSAQREILEETGIFFPITEFKNCIKICDTIYYILQIDSNDNVFIPQDKKEIAYCGFFDISSIYHINTNRTLQKALKQLDRLKAFLK